MTTQRLEGRVTNVSDVDLGSSLDGDHTVGATTLTVQDVSDFDEDGGTLVINDQQIDYSSCDDDTDTITLSEGLAAAADDGDTVSVWDTLREAIAVDKTAEVDVGPDYSDDIEAVVALHLVQHLVEGPRDDDGESVILELDEDDDEWKVIDILGLGGPEASGIRWEADDVYLITADDVAAGVAVMPLSHRPMNESVLAHWGGLPQAPTEYTVNYDDQTITWPLEGFELAGDRLWVHYAYLKGVKTRVVERDPVPPLYVAERSVFATTSSLAYPTGTQEGDLVILGMISGWDRNEICTDSRMTLVASVTRTDRDHMVYVGQASDLTTPLAVTISEPSGSTSQMAQATVAVFRGPGSEQLLHKPGAVAEVGDDGWVSGGASTTLQVPGLPGTDLSGAVMVFLANDGVGGVYGDQDWAKAPAYSLKVARDDAYIEIDMALTTTVPVPAQTTPNKQASSSMAWTAVVVGVQ